MRTAYELLLTHLSKDHAEVRFSSFQVIEELFPRSHLFRELLISDFRKFASLVAGTDPRLPLPLPKPAADQLKEKSLLAIRKWNDKYGDGYPKLKLGYNYLKVNKKVRPHYSFVVVLLECMECIKQSAFAVLFAR